MSDVPVSSSNSLALLVDLTLYTLSCIRQKRGFTLTREVINQCWKVLCEWLRTNFSKGKNIRIPYLGTIFQNEYKALAAKTNGEGFHVENEDPSTSTQIVKGKHEIRVASFVLSPEYAKKYNFNIKGEKVHRNNNANQKDNVASINYAKVVQVLRTSADTYFDISERIVKHIYAHLIYNFGMLVSKGETIALDISCCYFIGISGEIRPRFIQTSSPSNPYSHSMERIKNEHTLFSKAEKPPQPQPPTAYTPRTISLQSPRRRKLSGITAESLLLLQNEGSKCYTEETKLENATQEDRDKIDFDMSFDKLEHFLSRYYNGEKERKDFPGILNPYARTKAGVIESSDRADVDCLLTDKIGKNFNGAGARLFLDFEKRRIEFRENEIGLHSHEDIEIGLVDIVYSPRSHSGGPQGNPDTVTPRQTPTWRRNFDPKSHAVFAREKLSKREKRILGKGLTQYENPNVFKQLETALDVEASYAVDKDVIENHSKQSEECLKRYNWYIDNGIHDSVVPPMKEYWTENVVKLVSSCDERVLHADDKVVSELLCSLINEMEFRYTKSVKRAMLNYILKSEDERKRLGIPFIPHRFPMLEWGWGSQKPAPVVAKAIHASIAQAKMFLRNKLMISHPTMLELSWLCQDQELKKTTLVDLPTTMAECLQFNQCKNPVKISMFLLSHKRHMHKVRNQILAQWHAKAIKIFSDAAVEPADDAPDSTDKDSRKYIKDGHSFIGSLANLPTQMLKAILNAAATLMARQLRSIVFRSLERMLLFFRLFEEESTKSLPVPSPFLNTLTASVDGHIVFDTAPEQVIENLHEAVECIALALNGIPRVEQKGIGISLDSEEGEAVDTSARKEILKIDMADPYVVQVIDEIKGIAFRNLAGAELIRKRYSPYEFVLRGDQDIGSLRPDICSLEEYEQKIKVFRQVTADLQNNSRYKEAVCVGMQLCRCSELNALLEKQAKEFENDILEMIGEDTIQRNLETCKLFTEITDQLAKKPVDSVELVESERYLEETQGKTLRRLRHTVEDIKNRVDFLIAQKMKITTQILKPLGVTYSWLNKIGQIIDEAHSKLRMERERLEAQFMLSRDEFLSELTILDKELISFRTKGDMRMTKENLQDLENLEGSLSNAEDTAELIKEEEKRLGWTVSEFSKIGELHRGYTPFKQLWETIFEFQTLHHQWNHGVVFQLDAEEIEKKVDQIWKAAFKLTSQLSEDAPEAGLCASVVKEKLEEFRQLLPLIATVSNEGLRERHWQQMSQVLGFQIEPHDNMSLTRLLELKVDKHLEDLESISDTALKERSIELALDQMNDDWENLNFQPQSYKETETYVLQSIVVEDIQAVLDDHLMKTQTMRRSPYATFIVARIAKWETFLVDIRDLMLEWLRVQATWLYLEPIFSSQDIMKQMPQEGQNFLQVDANWRSIMNEVNKDSKCKNVMKIENILQRFNNAHKLLEEINKGLSKYLETKRLYFSRFFFLSNDELLEILAETKDPHRVQPFLKKCFEGIRALEFTNENKGDQISAMISSEGERVSLTSKIKTADAKGAAEVWLRQLEDEMRRAIQQVAKSAIANYSAKNRNQWVLDFPGQVVLAISSLFWTKEVEAALLEDERNMNDQGLSVSNGADSNNNALATYSEKLNEQLQEIVKLVRGQITKLERCTLSALAVIDVHARDVVQNLAENKVSSIKDFDWMAQLRYYWENDTIIVKMISSELEYAYEYLGNSSRLVITPLTDRCYRTLMGALHLQYGGAPEGPAGTGKTETTKDLAKALARQCVVFNCSDGLDYLAMAKFFKGLASSGAWACFDEFNRIGLEVLSVVAQQILSIQQAIAEKLHTFEFAGTTIKLRWTANVFITMNPGYAGRAELPDNLKALFRTVAMMIPDYSMISEIILFSYGYADSRNLAKKIVMTYTLCSEQLSSQDHYDYGMRAVISVLKAAGTLKQKMPNEPEDKIVLRSICDVNIAKFLSQDIPLFKGIISDLFVGVSLPEIDYTDMDNAIEASIGNLNIKPVPEFVEKVLQLYEMIIVRHGLMIVGLPLSGKTMCWKVLKRSLNYLHERKLQPCVFGEHELATDTYVINPKSITMGELYGSFDQVSHEWSDGILAKLFRNASKSTANRRKWLLFDGPVDAIWIENLNTVLDDNKKLCLMSGEIIAMSNEMNMIFEPMDLAVASPATVSRCGMVYMEPEKLGWKPLVKVWLDNTCTDVDTVAKTANKLGKTARKLLERCFYSLVPPLLLFIRKSVKEIAPTRNEFLVKTLVDMLDCLTKEHILTKEDNSTPAEIMRRRLSVSSRRFSFSSLSDIGDDVEDDLAGKDKTLAHLQKLFLFATVWSLGGTADFPGRKHFDRCFRELLVKNKISQTFPEEGLVYDYFLDSPKIPGALDCWRQWTEVIADKPDIRQDETLSSILVPTTDTIRYNYLLHKAVLNAKSILFVGPTGTGKSMYTSKYLLEKLDSEEYTVAFLNMSAQTTAKQVQSTIDSKLDKRRKGVFGPSGGKKCIVFLDDLNLPQPEKYGAQPPLELIRQGIKYTGWYDTKELSFRNIEGCQYVAAMGVPGGGRNHISPRLMRHFQVIGMTEFDDDTLVWIFTTLINWFLETKESFSSDIQTLSERIIKATLYVYRHAIKEFLPTPSKSHYLFNLRDFGRVIQGIALVKPNIISDDGEKFSRLWTHEVLRVFSDRLVDEYDRRAFAEGILSKALTTYFNKTYFELFEHLNEADSGIVTASEHWKTSSLIIFSHVGKAKKKTEATESWHYDELEDFGDAKLVLEEFLDEYNAMSPKRMDLVMFSYAIQHTLRILRILSLPGGHGLLVGVGGSGRQSLTRMAAYISSFTVFQIEPTKQYGVPEWREDLCQVIKSAGGEGKDIVFLLTDTHIKHESFIDDINNLLNSGEVPNMLEYDMKAEICEQARNAAKAENIKVKIDTEESLYAFVLQRVRQHLHIILAFSPVGDNFRTRIRKFPSLVNCCIFSCFSEWPSDALISVAQKFLGDFTCYGKLPDGDTTETPVNEVLEEKILKEKCVTLCKDFHLETMKYSKDFEAELRRHYYVTPTSYLELINTFKTVLTKKRSDVEATRKRYLVGLEKLQFTEDSVQGMRKELQDLQPVLLETTKEAEEMMKVVEKEQKEADKIAQLVKKDEEIANEKALQSKGIKDECESSLAEALPILQSAVDALNTLNKNDITEVKAMKNPPMGVKLVMEAVCIMCQVKPNRIKDPEDPSKKINDYWEPAKKQLLSDSHFLKNLIDYDKDAIDPKIISKATVYINNPDFEPDIVKKSSHAAFGLCCWVRAIVQYDKIAKVVAPKRKALEEAEYEYTILTNSLLEKQRELEKVENRVKGLAQQLQNCKDKKTDLENQVDECTQKLDRAEKLISGLGGQKTIWSDAVSALGEEYKNLTGDMLVCSGIVAYLGAFTLKYRRTISQEWIDAIFKMQIPCSGTSVRLVKALGNPIKIQDWTSKHGLPTDEFSIENGIIVSTSRRWPLMIDPQGQANKWVLSMEKEHGLKVVKLTDAGFLRTLENGIQFGNPVLLENIEETLPPVVEPLLLKQTFKKGGTLCIKLGENVVEYSSNFRFYISTKLANPHYLPEVSVKVTLLNFMITPLGLQDQLLGTIVSSERPDLENEMKTLIVQSADNKKMLKNIEDKILDVMTTSQGDILEDATAIEVLSKSQSVANEISEKQLVLESTTKKIDDARSKYVPVARRSVVLFFCIADLAGIDPMYQYSLEWFVKLYLLSIRHSETFADDINKRLAAINTHFMYSLYRNVCRSLLEKDKLLFSFLLCVRIIMASDADGDDRDFIHPAHWNFLLTGGITSSEQEQRNPCSSWLPESCWKQLCLFAETLSQVHDADTPQSFLESFAQDNWKPVFDSTDPYHEKMPGDWEILLSSFEKICILRCIRLDKVVPAIRDFIAVKIGTEYTESPSFDLTRCWNDSSPTVPLVFILSPGSDPMNSLTKLAESNLIALNSLSLGQGQGPLAERMVEESMNRGSWICLQNCHLYPSWMSTLERIVEDLGNKPPEPDFRLWLTSYPSSDFPISILQASVKMSNEPPKGLRSNLISSYKIDPISDAGFFETCLSKYEDAFKKLVFGLCFFHAVVRERRNFGSLGWNIPYEYNESDLRISVKQLRMFLEENTSDQFPFKAMQYTIGECNYGGKVTDDRDRITLMALLKSCLCEDAALREEYQLSPSGVYTILRPDKYYTYMDRLKTLPATAKPEVFGLHENADITKDRKETENLFNTMLLTQPRSESVSGQAPEKMVRSVAESILNKLPANFDLEWANQNYPVLHSESMNTVLCQELARYNALIQVVRESLRELVKATQGLVVMSSDLEKLFESVVKGFVPDPWKSKSYPTLKRLNDYVQDLLERLAFFNSWLTKGPPKVFWISGIFFTQSFLTGALQNFARKHSLPIDTVKFSFIILEERDDAALERPQNGVLVNGLFIEAAKWNYSSKILDESEPKILYVSAPAIHLLPSATFSAEAAANDFSASATSSNKNEQRYMYKCPVYKTAERRGTLSTTGHSTNYVMSIDLPSLKPPTHWIKRGTAFLLEKTS